MQQGPGEAHGQAQGHTESWTPRGNPDTLTHWLSVVTERSGGMDSEGRGPGLRDPAPNVDWPLGLWVAWGGQGKGSEKGEAWGGSLRKWLLGDTQP